MVPRGREARAPRIRSSGTGTPGGTARALCPDSKGKYKVRSPWSWQPVTRPLGDAQGIWEEQVPAAEEAGLPPRLGAPGDARGGGGHVYTCVTRPKD